MKTAKKNESDENKILQYQRKVWKEYKENVGLPLNYNYLYSNPIKVHVPIDTAINGIMIIGAYPTAHFNVIGSHKDVPVEDHLYPFSQEVYFDGSRVNEVKSGTEIENLFLKKLGIKRDDCWITDLVKVFLFKEGHLKKYEALGYKGHLETRSQFNTLAEKSKMYIDEEIEIANPKVIIGLGAEVNSILLRISIKNATAKMFNSESIKYRVNNKEYIYYPVAHPGILMREIERIGKWNNALNLSLKKISKSIN